jgi:hypothetical protein
MPLTGKDTMRLTGKDIEKLIEKLDVGEFHSVYGPTKFAGARVWEAWVWDESGKQWETRFFFEQGDEPIYFDSFLSLADHLNDLFVAASKEGGAIDWTRTKEMQDLQLKKITLLVAAFVFVGTVAAMLYQSLMARDAGSWTLVTTTLLGIVASGAALFFGKWIPIRGGGVGTNGGSEPAIARSGKPAPAYTKGGRRGKTGAA